MHTTHLTTVHERDGWHVASTLYKPPSKGSVGSGMIWCRAFATRRLARAMLAIIRFDRRPK